MTNVQDCTKQTHNEEEITKLLESPFTEDDIEWRVRAKRFLINR